jgi:signal peptidase
MVRLSRRLAGPALVVALAAAWFVTLRPAPLGGPAAFVVVSGHSMEPELSAGALVVARRRATYARGDVIVYRVPQGEPAAGTRVIHRVIGGSPAEGYVTQGDNRQAPDRWRPRAKDVEGAKLLAVPSAGRAMMFLGTPLAIAGLLAMLAFVSAGEQTLPRRLRRRGEADPAPPAPVHAPLPVTAAAIAVVPALPAQAVPVPVVEPAPPAGPAVEPAEADAPAPEPPAMLATPPRPRPDVAARRHRALTAGGAIVAGLAAAALVTRGARGR